MIILLPRLLFLKSFRAFGFPKTLPFNYTLLISTQCNARCKTCRIWKQKREELKIGEWEKILKSLGRSPFWITVSGGEPFLQPHLVDLCKLIFRTCPPAILNIPTNSLLFKTIPKKAEAILKSAKKTKVVINLSLDGVGKKHDEIRGIQGNFAAFEKNYKNLKKLKESYKNLTVGVHSVLSKFNVRDTEELFDYAFSLNPDQYITEIAEERAELGTVGMEITPSPEEYSEVINSLMERNEKRNFRGVARITQAFRREYYQLVKRVLVEKKQVIPCYAGWASAQISADGGVWPCCVRADNLGNLRDNNYNFAKIWFSEKANQARKKIKQKECWCPLASASYTNMLLNLGTGIKVLANFFHLE